MHVCRLRTIGNTFLAITHNNHKFFIQKFMFFFCSCSPLGQIKNKKEKIENKKIK